MCAKIPWNKGIKKVEDPNEIRECKKCHERKILHEFRRHLHLHIYECKKCYASKYRTGKPNLGRYKKGFIPETAWKKGNVAWNKGKNFLGNGRECNRYREWKNKVHERDGHKCTKCGNEERLHAHHILDFKNHHEKRFDIDNGITLCVSCHSKTENVFSKHRISGPHREDTKKKNLRGCQKKLDFEKKYNLKSLNKRSLRWQVQPTQ